MLRYVSPLLGNSVNLGSAIVYVFSGNINNASLGKVKIFNSALPITSQSVDISTIIPDTNSQIELEFPANASSILSVVIGGKLYPPSKTPDDLQPGEYKLDFANSKIIVRLI